MLLCEKFGHARRKEAPGSICLLVGSFSLFSGSRPGGDSAFQELALKFFMGLFFFSFASFFFSSVGIFQLSPPSLSSRVGWIGVAGQPTPYDVNMWVVGEIMACKDGQAIILGPGIHQFYERGKKKC